MILIDFNLILILLLEVFCPYPFDFGVMHGQLFVVLLFVILGSLSDFLEVIV